MTDTTPLDAAHAAMEAAPDDDAARLRFFERLAASELYVLLAREAAGGQADPELFDVGEARFVLVFDREDRLTAFTGRASPYLALSGRAIAGMLSEEGIGMGVNLEVAPSSILIPAEAVDWLAATLDQTPDQAEARIDTLLAPQGLPEALLTALDGRLALMEGMARTAWLAGARYDTGAQGHLLGIAGALPGAEEALAAAVNEALVFSGIEAGTLDVVFLRDSDAMTARLACVGLRFDIPQPLPSETAAPKAPGSDPTKPPILR